MKIKLLKPLPGAEVGTILEDDQFTRKGAVLVRFGDTVSTHDITTLIETGWAEEIKLEPERWYPKDGEKTYRLEGTYVEVFYPNGDGQANALRERADYGLCTQTREELENTLLLLKLRQSNGGWKPKVDELYYNLAIGGLVVYDNFDEDDDLCVNDILIGNCYRTREEAEKYAPEWKKLFSSINKE